MEADKDKLVSTDEQEGALIVESHIQNDKRSGKKRKRRNKNKIIFAAFTIIFLFIMAATGIYAFAGEYLMNQWRMATMSSKEYYIYIEKKSADKKIQTLVNAYSMVENVSNNYGDLVSNIASDIFDFNTDGGSLLPEGGIHVSVKLEDELVKAFGQLGVENLDIYLKKNSVEQEEDTYNNSESEATDKLVNNEKYSINQLLINNNGTEVFNINYLNDGQGGNYIQIKDYIDKFIKLPSMNTDTLMELLPSFIEDDKQNSLGETDILTEDYKDISLEELLKLFLEKFFYIMIENSGEAVLEKSMQFAKYDNKIKCNTITVEYSFEELREAFEELLLSLSYDENFYYMLNNVGLVKDKAEMKVYIAAIKTVINTASNAFKENGNLMMKLYVSNEGKILYRDIILSISVSAVSVNTKASINIGYGAGYGFSTPMFSIYDGEKQLIDLDIKTIESQEIILDEYPDKDNYIEIENIGKLIDIPELLKYIMESQEPFQPDISKTPTPTPTPLVENNVLEIYDSILQNENTEPSIPLKKPPIFHGPSITPKVEDEENVVFIKLGQYREMHFSMVAADVTEEEIDKYISDILQSYISLTKTNMPSKAGDTIVIDYVISVDDDYSIHDNDYEFVLGEDFYDDSLETLFYDVSELQSVTGIYILPEWHGDYEGMAAIFEAEVKGVYAYMAPELTDSFVKENFKYNTVQEYKKYIRENFEAIRKEEAEANLLSRIIRKIIQNSEMHHYPYNEIDLYKEQLLDYYKEFAKYQDMTEEELAITTFGMTLDEFHDYIVKTSEEAVLYEMVLMAVIDAEGFYVNDEQIEDMLIKYAKEYKYASVEELLKNYNIEEIRSTYALDMAREFLLENTILE